MVWMLTTNMCLQYPTEEYVHCVCGNHDFVEIRHIFVCNIYLKHNLGPKFHYSNEKIFITSFLKIYIINILLNFILIKKSTPFELSSVVNIIMQITT